MSFTSSTSRTLRRLGLALGVAGLALSAFTATDTEAGFRRSAGDNGDRRGYVVAESQYGNGSVAGPVRYARHGREVRLPGGTWVTCRRSCSETLRVETVDFWQSQQGGGGMTNECGIFGCLQLRF